MSEGWDATELFSPPLRHGGVDQDANVEIYKCGVDEAGGFAAK